MSKKLLLISVLALFLTACGNTKETSKEISDALQSKDAEIINNLDETNQQVTNSPENQNINESDNDKLTQNLPGENQDVPSIQNQQDGSEGNLSDKVTTYDNSQTDNSTNSRTDNPQNKDSSTGNTGDQSPSIGNDSSNKDDNEASTVPTGVPKTPEVTSTPTKAPDIVPIHTPVPTRTPIITPTRIPTPTKTPQPTKVPTVTVAPTKVPVATPSPTKVPAPTKTPTVTPPSNVSGADSISVRGKTISIGDSKSDVVSAFGSPNRTDDTEYNYDFMVYNDNYKKFMMIAIADSKVVGWYTDSTDFSYQGLSTSSKVSSINSVFGKSSSLSDTISISDSGNKITFFMDSIGDGTIDGISVFDNSVSKGSTSKTVLKAWEKEILDLTNSFRARNGLSALSWSDAAGTSARLHSEDMAKNNYFNHTGLDGSSPGDRMKAQGISYRSNGENIIGGYGNALFSSNGWMNSSGHRSNMLNKGFTYLGVGYALGGSYGNYATQNFYSN
ncbi:CAP domain-containing protein [Lachnoclostridium phytofermentans]|uniref:SCP-like extracellular n=1 Tax=Lachnoclostridium phytofermentans (strain ATCC 700394 / DSM 18823 / ISDg) TaxID=357809 RepID=A9KHG5_LACP7|nr:CAP domain-containing protein [Lachnoclostridium phytofermentans]ABX40832.1 SCP-like extracellular [Lachnoclostridium phytofermentans ISDg]